MVGELSGPRVDLTVAEMNRYMGQVETPPAGSSYACVSNGKYNKGCGYGMFNTFKALKLWHRTVARREPPGRDDWRPRRLV